MELLLYILLCLSYLTTLLLDSDGGVRSALNCTDPSKEAKEAEKKINEAELLSDRRSESQGGKHKNCNIDKQNGLSCWRLNNH